MLRNFIPSMSYQVISDIPISILQSRKVLLIDYDNTISAWRGDIDHKIINHLINIQQRIIIFSNGSQTRMDRIFKQHNIEAYGNCHKPLIGKIKQVLNQLMINSRECIFVGDNLITDIWVGNRLGCLTIKVKPISRKENPITKVWRIAEIPIRLYISTHPTTNKL